MRSRPEWIGKNDDSRPPISVQNRVFTKHNGCCHICGGQITVSDEYDYDHVKPLADGGENRESNLAPAHQKCHRSKTSQENSQRAITNRKRAKHLGIKKRSRWPNSRLKKKVDGTVVDRETGLPV